MKSKTFKFSYCVCKRKLMIKYQKSLVLARIDLHNRGWASTSIDRSTAKDICPKCLKHHKKYDTGREFKISIFAINRYNHPINNWSWLK